jgi:hypothetical protein
MATRLTINIAEPLRRRAKSIAALRGETISNVVREALESYVSTTKETQASTAGMPIENLDDWRADFWPADESLDEMIDTVRWWRRQDVEY